MKKKRERLVKLPSSVKPKTIGITGGLASGKTTIAREIESMGYPVFYADEVAKSLLVTDDDIRSSLLDWIGKDAYLPDGQPNRPLLARRFFSDDELLQKVNALIHPKVGQAFAAFVQSHDDSPLIFHEAALLYPSGLDKMLDMVIFVSVSSDVQLQRALSRNMSPEDAKNRIAAQGDLKEYESYATFIIPNNGNIDHLIAATRALIKQIHDQN